MLALSPPVFSTLGWPLEEPTSHEQSYFQTVSETSNLFLDQLPLSFPEAQFFNEATRSPSFSSSHPTMTKKLNHNASERDRRRKINDLYSSLRSLLPATEQTKKFSIPGTVSRVIKYIPEQQQQLQRLVQRKEELLSRISKQGDGAHKDNQRKCLIECNATTVSASQLGDREVVVQISTFKEHEIASISEIMLNLEVDGFHIVNAASFESYEARVFYTLHLQVEGTQRMDYEMLSEKLLSLYEKKAVS